MEQGGQAKAIDSLKASTELTHKGAESIGKLKISNNRVAGKRQPCYKKHMNPKSTRTFVWASVISLSLGMAVMSPSGSFFLYALAALAALIPAIIGGGRPRIAGAVLLAVSLALLAVTYQRYDIEMTGYKQRIQQKTSEGAKSAAPLQQEERSYRD